MKTFQKNVRQWTSLMISFALVFSVVFPYFNAFVPKVSAASVTVENAFINGFTLDRYSDFEQAFKLNFSDSGSETFDSLTLRLTPGGGATFSGSGSSVLKSLSGDGYMSGIAIYQDNAWGTANGTLDWDDSPLMVSTPTYSDQGDGSYAVSLNITGGGASLSTTSTYFVVLRAKEDGLSNGEGFAIGINNGDIVTSGTNPTFSNVLSGTISVQASAQISKVLYKQPDGGGGFTILTDGTLDLGDAIDIVFSVGVEVPGSIDSTAWAYSSTWMSRTFGTGASISRIQTNILNDTYRIILGTGVNIVDGDNLSVSTNDLNWNYIFDEVIIELIGPSLVSVTLMTDVGSDGAADAVGDVLEFRFNKPIDHETITSSNVGTTLAPSTGNYGLSNPTVRWVADNVLQLTLASSATNTVGATVDPSNAVTDTSGNSDGTAAPGPAIGVAAVIPPSAVSLLDPDSIYQGIDGNDIQVGWAATIDTVNFASYDIFILPSGTPLDTSVHNAINSSPITDINTNQYLGSTSTYALNQDSRFNYAMPGSATTYYMLVTGISYVAHVCSVTSSGDSSCATGPQVQFSEEYNINSSSAPWVKGTNPWWGEIIPYNIATVSLQFNEPMNSSSVTNTANYTVTKQSDSSSISISSVIYDSAQFAAVLSLGETLEANTTYEVTASSNITSSSSSMAISPYSFQFTTNSTTQGGAPIVSWQSIQNGATDISTYANIEFSFDRNMDPSTFTNSTVTISPTISGMARKYDPMTWSMKLYFDGDILTTSTVYTITLGTGITDNYGNAYAGSTLAFTTSSATNTVAPSISWCDSDGYDVWLGFSDAMKSSPLTTASNWTIKDAQGGPVSTSGANFMYDDYWNELHITGLNLTSEVTYSLNANGNIKGVNNEALGTTDCIFTVHSNYDSYEDAGWYDDTANYSYGMGADGTWDLTDGDMMNYTPVDVWPDNSMAGATTFYWFSVPTQQAIDAGGKIILTFPSGTDVSGAIMKANSWANEDINGGNSGTITISSISNDNVNKKITLTTAGGATAANDYLMFEINQIVNPSNTSTRDVSDGKGGNTVTFDFKSSNGTWLQQDLESNWFEFVEAGSGSITVTVQDASDSSAVENADVVCENWSIGWQEGTTNASGVATFSSLPTDNRDYWCWVEEAPSGYLANWNGKSIFLDSSNPTGSATVKLNAAPYTIQGTITHTGISTGGTTKAMVWASGMSGWMDTAVTLEADGSTDYSIGVTEGEWEIGLEPYFGEMKGGFANNSNMEFQPTNAGRFSVTSSTSPVTANMTLQVANLTIAGTVKDQTAAGLPNVEVYAFSNTSRSDSHTMTASDGSFSLKVMEGDYKVGVWSKGSMNPPEKSIMVAESGNNPASLAFVISKSTDSISGTVTDKAGKVVQYASVSAWNNSTGSFVDSFTDSTGNYSIFVTPGTWTVEAWAPPPLGKIGSSQVTVSSGVAATKNFSYDANNFATISGTVEDSQGNPMTDVNIYADSYNTTTWQMTGKWGDDFTDSDGTFSLSVEKNSATGELYRIGGHSWQYGELTEVTGIDISSGNSTGNTLTIPSTSAITVTVSNVPSDCSNVWVDAHNTTNWKWNGTEIRNFTSGTGSGTLNLSDGSWEINIWACTLDSQTSATVAGADANVSVDLSGVTTFTASGTVTSGENAISSATVDFFNPRTGKAISTTTNSSGAYSVTLKDGTWEVSAGKTGYTRSPISRITSSSATANLTLTSADSSITGTVYKSDGSTAEQYAWVWAESTVGDFTAEGADSSGVFTLELASGKTWTICAGGAGYEGCVSNVSSGATGANITLSSTIPGWKGMSPMSMTFDPGSALNKIDDNYEIQFPANAFTETMSNVQMSVKETKAPNIANMTAIATMDISLVNQTTNEKVSKTSQAATVKLKIKKSEIDDLISNGKATVNAMRNDLENMSASYYDPDTDSWKSADKTTVGAVQLVDSAGDTTNEAWSDFKSNMASDVTYYDDFSSYTIPITASTTHFSIYGVTFPNDTTAPSVPSSLTATAGNGSVVLDWADASESDFMEYEVYRSTSSGFTNSNSNQLNSSQLILSTYTDSTPTNGTTYYYHVTTVDTSGNESSSTEVSATPSSSTTESVSSGGGGGGAPSSSSEDEEEEAVLEEEESSEEEVSEKAVEESAEATAEEVSEAAEEASVSSGSLTPFADVSGHWAENYISELYGAGVVSGYDEDSFGPDDELTRAQLTKVVLNAFGIEVDTVDEDPFPDVSSDEWYAGYVAEALDLGIIQGYDDGTFRPDQNITRAEALKVVFETAGIAIADGYVSADAPFSDVDSNEWYGKYVDYAYDGDVVEGFGDGTFRPDQNITRAEFSKVTVKVGDLVGM